MKTSIALDQNKTGTAAWIPADAELRAILDAELAARPRTGDVHLVLNRS